MLVKQLVMAFEAMAKKLNGPANIPEIVKEVINESKIDASLDEKYFRRMDKLDNDAGKLRGWLFELTVCLGQIDEGLLNLVKYVTGNELIRKLAPDKWV